MKQRILSGLVMAIIFIIFYILGGNYVIFLTSLLGILMYKEIISLKKYPNIVIFLGLISLLSLIIFNSYEFVLGVKYYTLIFTFVSLLLPSLLPKYQKSYLTSDAFSLIAFIIFIALSLSAINNIMLNDRKIILYLVGCVIFNDIFAYLIGSKFGHIKYSKISKNKTLEGNIAGLIFGSVAGVLIYYFLISKANLGLVIIITIILNIFSQLGDLLFSKIKRENDIKDFSKLIPGHGGILDRLDSLLLTSLIYVFIITIL